MNSETRDWSFEYVQQQRGMSVYERLRHVENMANLTFEDRMYLMRVVLEDPIYENNTPLSFARERGQRTPLIITLEGVVPKNQRRHTSIPRSVRNGHPSELVRELFLTLGDCNFGIMRGRAKYVDSVISDVFPLES